MSVVLLVNLAIVPLSADDGAASIAVGGVVAMRREPRIMMAKEVLQISASKVIVDYDFRNDSDEDITTAVAFPVPEYDLAMDEGLQSEQSFDDFRLWVSGAPTRYLTEAKAFLKDKEYTKLLTEMHVDIASFGHFTSNSDSRYILKLTPTQHQQLEKLGLIGREDGGPLWKVKKSYYWQQTFPAHKTVHVRHEYAPRLGSSNSIKYGMGDSPDPGSAEELKSFCLDSQLHGILHHVASSRDRDAPYFYVDFILTTANTWKRPIEDFTLIVERGHSKESLTRYVSFCWDGPITKTDPDHFSAHVTNLVPTKELRVGFFDVEKSRF
jgi:hypothetical protein